MDLRKVEGLASGITSGLAMSSEWLDSLYLDLLCTHDVLKIANVLPQSTKARLRSLHISINDTTGPGGSDIYLEEHHLDDGDDENDSKRIAEMSPLQRKYPNIKYTFAVVDLVKACQNLTELSLQAAHFLDLEGLDLSNLSSGLKLVCLCRVRMSASKLVEIIESPSGSIPALRTLSLTDVEVTNGTWSEVLATLLPRTRYLLDVYDYLWVLSIRAIKPRVHYRSVYHFNLSFSSSKPNPAIASPSILP